MSSRWNSKERRPARRPTKVRTPRVRVAVALVQDDTVLLVRHQKRDRSYWLLPGGGLEFGESMREAAQREMLEETGLQIEVGAFLMAAESLAPDRSRHVVHVMFRGQIVGGELQLGDEHIDPSERRIVEVAWVPLTDIGALVLHPPLAKELLEGLARPLPGTVFLDNLWVD